MRDLCDQTGLERQTIHFYIQEGLLPEGTKTGRNTAFYGEEHLERLFVIKRLKDERFLPLRAIRAVLGGKAQGFSKEQRALLSEVKLRLASGPGTRPLAATVAELCDARELASEAKVPLSDVDELAAAGLLHGERRGGALFVRRDAAWIVTAWAELQRAGLDRSRGFTPRDLAMLDDAVTDLFAKERDLFFDRFSHLSPSEIAGALERALPVLNDVLSRLHTDKVKDTFAAFADARPRPVRRAAEPAKSARASHPLSRVRRSPC